MTTTVLLGESLVVPEVSTLKEMYGKRPKRITVPIGIRVVSDNGIDTVFRRVLDVRNKSNRQRTILAEIGGRL